VGQQGAVMAVAGGVLDVVDVAGDTGNALQAALGIDQRRQLLGRHVVVFNQVDHHRRVDAAGAAGHDQAVGGGHAHAGVHRAAVVDGAQGGADAQVTGDDFQFAERALQHFGRFQRNVAVRGAVEAVATDPVLLVEVVGQAVQVGVGRQGLVEGGVEDGHVGHVRQLPHGLADAFHVDRVVQRRKDRQGFDVGNHRGGDDHGAGKLAAPMDDPVADRGDVFGMESECIAEQAGGFLDHPEQLGEGEGVAGQGFDLGAHHHADAGYAVIGIVDDAVHIGAEVLGVVDAEVDLADPDVEHQHLARAVGVQGQGVGVVGLAHGAAVAGDKIHRHRPHAVEEQARQVADGLGVGEDLGIEDAQRNQQHEAAIAGDHISGDAVAGEGGHHAEDIARAELADHRAGAGVVGDGNLRVAGDHHTDELALVAGFQDRLVSLVGGQVALADDFLDLVGREIFEQTDLFEEKPLQINFAHADSRFKNGGAVDQRIVSLLRRSKRLSPHCVAATPAKRGLRRESKAECTIRTCRKYKNGLVRPPE
jgi:hypothetical protein